MSRWICTRCGEVLEPQEVTFEERHDSTACMGRVVCQDAAEDNEQEMLRIHQEMLDLIHEGTSPIEVPYGQIVDWFNTIKEFWPWRVQ